MLGHLAVQTDYSEDLASINRYINHHHRVDSSSDGAVEDGRNL